MSRCLYCYQELGEGETDFHPQCGKKIFGSKTVPLLPYTKADIKQLAEQVIRSQTTLTGVQAKLSLDISSSPNHTGGNRIGHYLEISQLYPEWR